MKKATLPFLLFALAIASVSAQSASPDWAALSKRLIDETAGIKAGQKVLLMGGQHTLPLLEQLGADLHRKGANPIVVIETTTLEIDGRVVIRDGKIVL
jgi:hypothetical protein